MQSFGEREDRLCTLTVKADWAATPFHQRAAIFLKAAELLAGRHRARINAATMLGQSKTCHQAEIDAACESIDFLRFNVHFAEEILAQQPRSEPGTGVWNQTDYRPLDGFVLAIAPFNFTAIALNLCTAPALMGNVVLFKPAPTATLSAWHLCEVLREAGLPDGVIQFLPGPDVGRTALASPDLGGLHFTGSTATFQTLWKEVGNRIASYRQYPRLVGETGGKDFIVVHPSAWGDLDAVVTAIVRGGFEYQGQKCSAASRLYLPQSLWPKLESRLRDEIAALKMGDVRDFRNFMGAVIDQRSFAKAERYLATARAANGAELLAGGNGDGREGWFIEPTLVRLHDPKHPILTEEIFAPIVGAYVYPDAEYEETLRLCDRSTPYALTGAVFARDRAAIDQATALLRHAAGNFYINDKPTGAVVGQQPFGGGRASGTNDKAGSALNLLRWASPRTVKETFTPPREVRYPWMAQE